MKYNVEKTFYTKKGFFGLIKYKVNTYAIVDEKGDWHGHFEYYGDALVEMLRLVKEDIELNFFDEQIMKLEALQNAKHGLSMTVVCGIADVLIEICKELKFRSEIA